MVHESKEALNIIEDMTEEQIISMEDADEGDGEEAESLDNIPGAGDCYRLYLVSIHEYAAR